MRYFLIALVVVLFSACRRDETAFTAKTTVAAGKVQPQSGGRFRQEVSGIPALDKLGSGDLDRRGMAAVFEQVTALPLPNYVIPIAGDYKVYAEDHGRGPNSRSFKAHYTCPPENTLGLYSEIRDQWEKTFLVIPDWEFGEQGPTEAESFMDEVRFGPGSIHLFVSNPYAYYCEGYSIRVDRGTGVMVLSGSNHRNEHPRDRQVEEKAARMDKERR